jgi:hypothetical protein
MDSIYDWIPGLTSSGLLAFTLYLFRKVISVRLTQSVKSEFDTKLAGLQSELRTKEAQINALQTGALSGLVNRQSKMYEKQIEAIEQIWEAKSQLSKGVYLVNTMAIVKFDASSKESVKNPQMSAMFETIGGDLKITDFNLESAKKCRPFISDLAWAYYSAYQTIIFLAFTKMDVIRKGIDNPEQFFSFKGGDSLLKSVLPSYSELIEQDVDGSHHAYFLDEIEKLLLLELKNIQSGSKSDIENTQRAAAILKESEELMKVEMEGVNKA